MRALANPLVLVLTGALAALAQTATTQPGKLSPGVERVLKYIPDDAHLVVVVPCIDELSRGIAAFGKSLGATDLSSASALDMLAEHLGTTAAAIDTNGALVVALSAERDEPVVIAALTSDEKWRSATQPTPLGADVQLFEFGPDRYVAASVGTVAIFGREKAELNQALNSTGKVAGRFVAETANTPAPRQIYVYIDLPSWRESIEAQMAVVAQGMSLGMAAAGPDGEAAMQIWNWMLGQLKKSLAETQTLVATTRIDAQGVFADARVTFKPDSPLARYLKQVQRPGRDLLRGLPSGEAPVVLAFEWEDAPDTVGFNEALCRVVLGMESLKQKVGPEKVDAVMKRSIALNHRIAGSSAVFTIVPEGGGMLYWGLYLTKDGPAVQRELRAIFEAAPDMMSAWGSFPAAMRPHEPEKFGSVEADVYQLNFAADGAPVPPMLTAVYGKDPTLYMAAHPEGVVYAFGPQDQSRKKLGELLAPGAVPLSQDPRMVELFKTLTPNPQLCMAFDLPVVMKNVAAMVDHMGLPFPKIDIAAAPGALAGCTLYLEPDAARGEVYVPTQALKPLIKAFEDLEDPAEKAY